MSELRPGMPPEEEKREPFVPSSFEKRVAAWVGVFYMVMLLFATTYMIATAKVLTGVAPLLLPPAAVGVSVIAIYRHKQGKMRVDGSKWFTPALVFLCFLAFILGLMTGLPVLLAHFGIYLEAFPVTLS